MSWKGIGQRLGVAPTTAIYLYGCHATPGEPAYGVRRAIIATLGLAGPRVTELCQLDNQDIDLRKARFHIRDSKTESGIRTVDIHPRLLDELAHYTNRRGPMAMNAPAFPTRTGARRDKDNVRSRMIFPAVARANELRAHRGQPPIRTHVTPHTFRRTYVTFLVAGGYDLPYVQAQVGHNNPSLTLSIYAQLMRRADRDELRTEIRELLESPSVPAAEGTAAPPIAQEAAPLTTATGRFRAAEKAGKGRRLNL
jgi:integrase